MAKRPEDATARFSLRLPEHLRARLEAEATRHGISLNAQMVLGLESSLYQGHIGQTVFGDENIYTAVSAIAQVIRNIEAVEGKKLKDEFGNILRRAVELVIQFSEKSAAAIVNCEHSRGFREATDAAVFATMIRTLIRALPPEDLEALLRESRQITEEAD